MPESFEEMVKQSWTHAVNAACNDINKYRDELLKGLHSTEPDVRSAAVCSFLEAKDHSAHDFILRLIDDCDRAVRMEVAEYLYDFATPGDAEMIFERLMKDRELLFLMSGALRHLTERDDGIISDDDADTEIEREIDSWRVYLIENGYMKK